MKEPQIYYQHADTGEGRGIGTSGIFPLRGRDDTKPPPSSEGEMPETTFETFVMEERQRLTKAREDALAKRAEIDEQIKAIEIELGAIDAYEAAKTGRGRSTRKRGTRRSGRRNEVFEAVKKHPKGITRGDLLQMMGAKGNKPEETSISNALSALKRAEKITQDDEGRYLVPNHSGDTKTAAEAVTSTSK